MSGRRGTTKPKLMSGITFNVLVLGVTSLLTDASSEMVFALLPFFMIDVLGAKMVVVGLIEGAAETAASLLRVFSGWLSDKMRRRKPLIVLGYSTSAILRPLFAFATSPIHAIILFLGLWTVFRHRGRRSASNRPRSSYRRGEGCRLWGASTHP